MYVSMVNDFKQNMGLLQTFQTFRDLFTDFPYLSSKLVSWNTHLRHPGQQYKKRNITIFIWSKIHSYDWIVVSSFNFCIGGGKKWNSRLSTLPRQVVCIVFKDFKASKWNSRTFKTLCKSCLINFLSLFRVWFLCFFYWSCPYQLKY